MNTDLFDYNLPEPLIAQAPLEPRDSSRLLRADTLEDRLFVDLPDLLAPGDVVVVNRTRVRAARLIGTKPQTGGSVELLLLRRLEDERWEALIRPARRIRPGVSLDFGDIQGEVISGPQRGEVVVSLRTNGRDIEEVVADAGQVPLPPYIHTDIENPERYQTVFASSVGSAAAPTAALHFTEDMVDRMQKGGIAFAEVELEIGLDTFRPISTDSIADHTMHTEAWTVPEAAAQAIAMAKGNGGRVVAVGTTVVRTLESAADENGSVVAGHGDTDLFISPGYTMKAVDVVLTNFHAPRTTLIVMISTLLGERWRQVYEHAVASKYRFLSFGDSMLIERPVNHR